MTMLIEAASRFMPGVRAERKRQRLEELASEAMPEFEKLIDFHARTRKSFEPKRLRNLLENHKAAVAFVDGGPFFRLISDSNLLDQVFLMVVVNPGKFLRSQFGQRNDAISDLLDQFSKARRRFRPGQTISKFDFMLYPAESTLKANGVNP